MNLFRCVYHGSGVWMLLAEEGRMVWIESIWTCASLAQHPTGYNLTQIIELILLQTFIWFLVGLVWCGFFLPFFFSFSLY